MPFDLNWYRGAYITRRFVYELELGREIDPAGDWTYTWHQVENGMTQEGMILAIRDSAEWGIKREAKLLTASFGAGVAPDVYYHNGYCYMAGQQDGPVIRVIRWKAGRLAPPLSIEPVASWPLNSGAQAYAKLGGQQGGQLYLIYRNRVDERDVAFLRNLATGNEETLGPAPGVYPFAWSHDGTWVGYRKPENKTGAYDIVTGALRPDETRSTSQGLSWLENDGTPIYRDDTNITYLPWGVRPDKAGDLVAVQQPSDTREIRCRTAELELNLFGGGNKELPEPAASTDGKYYAVAIGQPWRVAEFTKAGMKPIPPQISPEHRADFLTMILANGKAEVEQLSRFYQKRSSTTRKAIRDAHKAAGMTRYYLPVLQDNYDGFANPEDLLPYLKELYNDGLGPVLFIAPEDAPNMKAKYSPVSVFNKGLLDAVKVWRPFIVELCIGVEASETWKNPNDILDIIQVVSRAYPDLPIALHLNSGDVRPDNAGSTFWREARAAGLDFFDYQFNHPDHLTGFLADINRVDEELAAARDAVKGTGIIVRGSEYAYFGPNPSASTISEIRTKGYAIGDKIRREGHDFCNGGSKA